MKFHFFSLKSENLAGRAHELWLNYIFLYAAFKKSDMIKNIY